MEENWKLILTIAVIVFSGFSLCKIGDWLFKKLTKKEYLHTKYMKYIAKLFVALVCIGLIANLFPNTKRALSLLLASSGLIVAVLGFAAQESLSNMINGLFISIFKPFEIGNRVTLVNSNITGNIEDLTLRHTVIRTVTNTRLIIPNSTMNKEIIENSHYTDTRAANLFDVWVSYESDLRLAMTIVADLIEAHPLTIDVRTDFSNPMVNVLVRELGENGICLRATVWTANVDDNFKACSDLRILVKEQFAKNQISIPYRHLQILTKQERNQTNDEENL